MIVLSAPTFNDGQSVLTFAERPMVPCYDLRCANCGESALRASGFCIDHQPLPLYRKPLTAGTRVAIARPCGCWWPSDGTAWKGCGHCKGLGALIVASGVVEDVVQVKHLTQPRQRPCLVLSSTGAYLHATDRLNSKGVPLSAIAPGKPDWWAVVLTDVAPTVGRCPACWGRMLHDFNCDAPNGPIPVACTGDVTEVEP